MEVISIYTPPPGTNRVIYELLVMMLRRIDDFFNSGKRTPGRVDGFGK